jgi:hypothetical protein
VPRPWKLADEACHSERKPLDVLSEAVSLWLANFLLEGVGG